MEKWDQKKEGAGMGDYVKGTKAGHRELDRNDPEVKIMGGTEQEG